ncbi:DUF1266 domain-containing protein [Anaerocolumna sp. AGMB13020]|uniref:DUF1266 domain-containing protein n=1 Tax=Anaerocolumna sp. AGMB13020 TaxID=3081750 RepID=UPI0029534CF3|nr:DUF1266 domain-containing protein [Anaerocolumna sp. AGMB13020]WOO38129.1 DUF1266 domain-containing protein [Anaerocolumna sp. AGMB13020]
MKRSLTALLLLFALLLTGCSNGTGTDSKTEAPAEVTITKETLSDTLRWFNAAYAIITTRNGGDINLIGGYGTKNLLEVQMIKSGLKESWEVTDKTTADDTLNWLLEEGGHNAELLEEYKENSLSEYTREELIEVLSVSSYTDNDRAYYLGLYDAVANYSDNAILAWDLSRAMQLSAWYYLAGYYTYEEAMDKSLAIAKSLQKAYGSWDEMADSYLYGYQYWSGDDMSDETSESFARYQIYQELVKQTDSPYSIDWNYELQKDWP